MSMILACMMMFSATAAELPPGLEGRWIATGGNRDTAVDDLVGEMSKFKRPFARARLNRVTKPCDEIEIWSVGDRLAIGCDDHPPVVDRPDGRPVAYTAGSGETYSVSIEVGPDGIVQTFEAEAGRRTNTYRVSGDTLDLQVTVSSEKLPRDLNYMRTFRRADSPATSS